MVATFLLTWNPERWNDPDFVESAIELTGRGELSADSWSTGNRTSGIERGDHAFLLRQHDNRGIVASGTFLSEVHPGEHWDDDRGDTANYADLALDMWLPAEDRLPVDTLKAEVPEIAWDRLQASGVLVDEDVAETLAELWENHLSDLGIEWTPIDSLPELQPEEIDPGETFAEGAVAEVLVNRYERDPRARQACIEEYGYDCAVCGFNFEERYGELGKEFIHVHHLTDLSTVGDDYEVDPKQDMRPVCANCHSMLHRDSRPARTIEALQELLQ